MHELKTSEPAESAVHSSGLVVLRRCADCGVVIGKDSGPKDGWQLEDGRTVCQACCVTDTKRFVGRVIWHASRPNVELNQPAPDVRRSTGVTD